MCNSHRTCLDTCSRSASFSVSGLHVCPREAGSGHGAGAAWRPPPACGCRSPRRSPPSPAAVARDRSRARPSWPWIGDPSSNQTRAALVRRRLDHQRAVEPPIQHDTRADAPQASPVACQSPWASVRSSQRGSVAELPPTVGAHGRTLRSRLRSGHAAWPCAGGGRRAVHPEHAEEGAVARGLRGGRGRRRRLAEEQLGKRSYDVLLFDVALPDGDGVELLEAPARRGQRRAGDHDERPRHGRRRRSRHQARRTRLPRKAAVHRSLAGGGGKHVPPDARRGGGRGAARRGRLLRRAGGRQPRHARAARADRRAPPRAGQRAAHRRARHRQGAGRAGHPPRCRRAPRARSRSSTAPPCPPS